jgi:type I restriction enzyme S subunit
MVPEGWMRGVFEDGIELISGQHVEAKYVNNSGVGKPYLTGPADFPNEKIIVSKFTVEGKKFSQKGDLLITVKGSGTGKVIESDDSYAISRQLMAIRPQKFDRGFVFYNLLASISRYEGAAAGLIPGISRDDVLHTPILIPPLPEQKKIAQILSTWDKAITVTEKLLANSQQQKKALMQQLLTGKKRLLDKNGVRFTGEWKSYELGDWIREYSEKSVSSDQYEVLTSSRGGLVKQSEYFADSRIGQRDNIGFNIIPPGYITYRSRSDDGQFFFNRNEFSFTGIISIYYPVFHFPDGDSTFFLNYLNRSSSKFSGYSVGTSQKVLSLNALKSFKAKLPRKEEQQKIAKVLSAADQEISALQQKMGALKQEKKALMQQLLTGKRRVKT